jgi:hypothetical protein
VLIKNGKMSRWRSQYNSVEIWVYSDEITETKVRFVAIPENRRDTATICYFSKPAILLENYDPLDRAALRDYIKWKK